VDRCFSTKSPAQPYDRESLVHRLKDAGQIAISIDEADRVLGESWAGSFLFYLRWMDDTALRSQVAFLLIGGPMLADYRNPDDHGSPPLNTAEPVYIEPLAPADVSEMLVGLPSAVTTNKILQEAGGHPWLINRLLAEVWDGKKLQTAVDDVWDIAIRNFKIWHRQIGETGVAFLRAMPNKGLSISEFRRGKMVQHREALLRCRYTCLVRRGDKGIYQPGPRLFLDWLSAIHGEAQTWDIAISYASEDESLAKAIYDQLRPHLRVFFAPAEVAYMWGQDLNKVLPNTYGVDSRLVLILSSDSYVKKHWTNMEFKAALEALGFERLMIVNLGSLPRILPPNIVVMNANPANLVSLVANIRTKVAHTLA
jgi:hypothetical protein